MWMCVRACERAGACVRVAQLQHIEKERKQKRAVCCAFFKHPEHRDAECMILLVHNRGKAGTLNWIMMTYQ